MEERNTDFGKTRTFGQVRIYLSRFLGSNIEAICARALRTTFARLCALWDEGLEYRSLITIVFRRIAPDPGSSDIPTLTKRYPSPGP